MKLTTILILTASMSLSARAVSQQVTLTVKNVTLESALQTIKAQTGYTFFYNDRDIARAKPVTLSLNKVPIEQAMAELFKEQPLRYEIKGTTIIVSAKEAAKPLAVTGGLNPGAETPPANIDVTIIVLNTDNQPLEGASIIIKGSNKGIATDINGRATLRGVDVSATMIISFTGYASQEYKLASNPGLKSGVNTPTPVVIRLVASANELDEVTVNKGYYTEKQRNTVGNVTTVTAKDIEKQPVQNPLLALQGRVPGLEVTQLSGMNGGGVSIQIQGNNSIGSLTGLTRTDPFIVIDGVPYLVTFTGMTGIFENGILKGGSPLNYINPSDIESIDILKDADATAIYGSRAANGAILITTKRGKAGTPKLSLNMQQGWSKVTQHVDMLNTRQYLDMRYEAFRNAGVNFAQSSVSANDLKVWDTTRYTDWQKELLGASALYTNINASLSGGTQLMQYVISGTFNRRTTVFSGNMDDKVGAFHFNLGTGTANQRLKLQLTGSYTYDQNKLPGSDLTSQAILLAPNAPSLYNSDGSLNWAPDATGKSTWANPIAAQINGREFNSSTRTLVSNVLLSYRIFKGLDFRTSLGYSNMQAETFSLQRLETLPPESRPNGTRFAYYTDRNANTWIIEPQLVYTKTWGENKIDGMVGTTIQESASTYLDISASGYPSDELMKTMLAAQSITINSSVSVNNRYNALFGRFNYNYRNKYILNFTARRDGSNRFGDNNKFSNFWSTGAGWIFSDESFVQKNLPFLSFGKIRASYGTTGNDQIQDFSYVSIYNILSTPLLYQNTLSFYASNIPNPYLQWEVTRKLQGGIDLGFFKDRVNLGVTYARNRSSNQLVNYSVPLITGNFSYPKNLPALIQNSSWEFVLRTLNIKRGSFSWNTNFNLTIPRNMLLSFPGIEKTTYSNPINGNVVIGQPLGVLSLFRYAGMNPANGRYLTFDQNGNALSVGNRGKFVSTNTTYYGGFGNNLSYRGFQFDIFFQFVRKIGPRDFYWSSGNYPGVFSATNSNQPVSVMNRWQKPGDNTLVPPFNTTAGSTTITSTDAYYNYDVSFIRLKNIALSWQLPSAIIKKAGVQNARLYCNAQNLHVFSKYKGMDPETGATNLPPLMTVIVGAQIDF